MRVQPRNLVTDDIFQVVGHKRGRFQFERVFLNDTVDHPQRVLITHKGRRTANLYLGRGSHTRTGIGYDHTGYPTLQHLVDTGICRHENVVDLQSGIRAYKIFTFNILVTGNHYLFHRIGGCRKGNVYAGISGIGLFLRLHTDKRIEQLHPLLVGNQYRVPAVHTTDGSRFCAFQLHGCTGKDFARLVFDNTGDINLACGRFLFNKVCITLLLIIEIGAVKTQIKYFRNRLVLYRDIQMSDFTYLVTLV